LAATTPTRAAAAAAAAEATAAAAAAECKRGIRNRRSHRNGHISNRNY